MMEMSEKPVLVTGAGGGIGGAIAEAFAAIGATVIVADVNGDSAREMAERIRLDGGRADACVLDVSDRQACSTVIRDIVATNGNLSVVINNAGINRRVSIDDAEANDAWDVILGVNVNGMYNVARASIGSLRQTKGSIVNIASIQSFITFPNSIAYTTSKGAVMQMTKAMAVEFAKSGVRVNAVAPGFVATAMTAPTRANDERMLQLNERIPLSRFAKPEEIAGPVLFLASKAASYMTGSILVVDGGFIAT